MNQLPEFILDILNVRLLVIYCLGCITSCSKSFK